MKTPVNVFWFRRDLRLHDNTGLYHALRSGLPVLPLFIFDRAILDKLPRTDARVGFIHFTLQGLHRTLSDHSCGIVTRIGEPQECWEDILSTYDVRAVFYNHDYEPYARDRDQNVEILLGKRKIPVYSFKDQVIFEKGEVVKDDGKPYTVYTPYMRKWLRHLGEQGVKPYPSEKYLGQLAKIPPVDFPDLGTIGFERTGTRVPECETGEQLIAAYPRMRDIPAQAATSRIGPHLRFGLVGIRELVEKVWPLDPTYLKELVWREFFMQVLWHFPKVVNTSFREQYDRVAWINDEDHFSRWCKGTTGYPIVDAGMRQLKATGFMHNRVRMITASFLCKHLLTDWRWGEAWFARHLLDYELSSNNGNWQWAAGTGCDAAPYFRVFNPATQQSKFDPEMIYIKRWVPEYGTPSYPSPIVDHKVARERSIAAYKKALS